MRFVLLNCFVLTTALGGCGGGSGASDTTTGSSGTSGSSDNAANNEVTISNSLGTVSIDGQAQVGETLSAVVVDSNGLAGASITYTWVGDGVAIQDSTGQQLVLTSAEVGATIGLSVSYTDNDGFTENPSSVETSAVIEASSVVDEVPVSEEVPVNEEASINIVGISQMGETLTAVVTDLDGIGDDVTYQWFVNDAAIENANLDTYDLLGADVGATISVSADYIDDAGFSEEPLSDASDVVLAAYGLDPDLPPGENFDLLGWYLSTPEENSSGLSTRIPEVDLAGGYEDSEYFWTADDGGMVFRVTNAGARTSTNTSYPRTELREMLRRGDTSISTRNSDGTPTLNNWVFSSAPDEAQDAAGAVDGQLRGTLAVNAVTTSGISWRVGRVIVGQIHAKDDEPIRLYYRKLPDNERGSIYAAHEINGGDDIYYEILGNRSSSASDPSDGIALDELWSYEILAAGNQLTVTIRSGDFDGEILGTADIDMSESGYDIAAEFMYFKAGAYNQNNTSDGGLADDFSQVTFYQLEANHD